MNDWEDPYYFTSAFPCLFPFGTGGHLEQRKGPMSLETWAKWTIQHHFHRYIHIVHIIEQANFNYRFARHPVFMFLVYDVIHKRKAALGYSLLVKSGMWEKTEELICEITYAQLTATATKIKETNRYTDAAILALERHVQTVAAHIPHLYARCFQFRLRLKALMVANGIPVFWITFNSADLRCPLIIHLAGLELELSSEIQSAF